jgi:chromosome segregation ATPase
VERSASEREVAAANAAIQEQLSGLRSEVTVYRQQVAERVAGEGQAVEAIKAQLTVMSGEIATGRQEAADRAAGQREIAAAGEAIVSRVERGFEALDGRISQIEHTLEELRGHTSQFERNIAADLVDVEQSLKTQSVAIESARTAMSQTDDLVERVVEALESLQMAVMDQGTGVEHTAGSVN